MSAPTFECAGCRTVLPTARLADPRAPLCEYCAPWCSIYGAGGVWHGWKEPLDDVRALALVRALHRLESRVDALERNPSTPATSPATNERPEERNR